MDEGAYPFVYSVLLAIFGNLLITLPSLYGVAGFLTPRDVSKKFYMWVGWWSIIGALLFFLLWILVMSPSAFVIHYHFVISGGVYMLFGLLGLVSGTLIISVSMKSAPNTGVDKNKDRWISRSLLYFILVVNVMCITAFWCTFFTYRALENPVQFALLDSAVNHSLIVAIVLMFINVLPWVVYLVSLSRTKPYIDGLGVIITGAAFAFAAVVFLGIMGFLNGVYVFWACMHPDPMHPCNAILVQSLVLTGLVISILNGFLLCFPFVGLFCAPFLWPVRHKTVD